MKAFFVTGTDTEVGKTTVTAGLMAACVKNGLRVAGLKPVAAGCTKIKGQLCSDDALQLIDASNVELEYRHVNPIALAPPIAPHIAAQQAGVELSVEVLIAWSRRVVKDTADVYFVEGAGGWYVPLNSSESLADFAIALNFPVVMVVGIRLGCINHALLTMTAVREAGLPLAGWVANEIDPTNSVIDENVATLSSAIRSPLLGRVPCLDKPTATNCAAHFEASALLHGLAT